MSIFVEYPDLKIPSSVNKEVNLSNTDHNKGLEKTIPLNKNNQDYPPNASNNTNSQRNNSNQIEGNLREQPPLVYQNKGQSIEDGLEAKKGVANPGARLPEKNSQVEERVRTNK